MELKNSYLHCSAINELGEEVKKVRETVLPKRPHHAVGRVKNLCNTSFTNSNRNNNSRNTGSMYGYKDF